MFRKSILFFVLIALLWLVLWSWIPDISPDQFSISDVFRSILLVFAAMAFFFAGLMLLVRYKGVDIATSFIPHSGLVLWLGKHAYEYSQPKVILHCTYQGSARSTKVKIKHCEGGIKQKLKTGQSETIKIGHIESNPVISWLNSNDELQTHELNIIANIKLIGKNLNYRLNLTDTTLDWKKVD